MNSQTRKLLADRPHLQPLHDELGAAWKAVEAQRIDDPFFRRAMIRFGKALVAFHEALLDETEIRQAAEDLKAMVEKARELLKEGDDEATIAWLLGRGA